MSHPTLLLIADIGGYTRFMQVTRANLAHSHMMVAELLEAVIDAASPMFELSKLEGDAAFFYMPLKRGLPSPQEIEQVLARMKRAFDRTLQRHVVEAMCNCEGCVKAGELTLKFVAHAGEVAFQKVKQFTELAGVDVIIVHRMLKNDVPVREYVLFTEPLLAGAPPSLKDAVQPLRHDFEGIGEVQTYYGELSRLPVPAEKPTARQGLVKFFARLGFVFRTLPYLVGFKKPAQDFRNFDPAVGGLERKRELAA